MTKSAIEKMVEWGKREGYDGTNHLFREARRLLAEEQAQKPTAPAGLVEELDNLIMESPCNPTPHENMDFKNGVQLILSRYRPAPSSEDGLREALAYFRHMYEGSHKYTYTQALEMAICKCEDILSRHPSTKSDRCGDHFVEVNKLVKRLREHISDQKLKEADYLVYDEIEAIINEFSKDADGKEGR